MRRCIYVCFLSSRLLCWNGLFSETTCLLNSFFIYIQNNVSKPQWNTVMKYFLRGYMLVKFTTYFIERLSICTNIVIWKSFWQMNKSRKYQVTTSSNWSRFPFLWNWLNNRIFWCRFLITLAGLLQQNIDCSQELVIWFEIMLGILGNRLFKIDFCWTKL